MTRNQRKQRRDLILRILLALAAIWLASALAVAL